MEDLWRGFCVVLDLSLHRDDAFLSCFLFSIFGGFFNLFRVASRLGSAGASERYLKINS